MKKSSAGPRAVVGTQDVSGLEFLRLDPQAKLDAVEALRYDQR